MVKRGLIVTLFLTSTSVAAGLETPSLPDPSLIPQSINWQLTNAYPHDELAYTQGLVYDSGTLYESTGLYGYSGVRKVDLPTGQIISSVELDTQHFGEGLTLHDGFLYQITWRNGTAYLYRPGDLQPMDERHFGGEGWGLASDGNYLILSDGSAQLQFLEPQSFRQFRTVEVRDQYGPVMRLNELEYIHGQIYANMLYDNRIARIDPLTGQVTGWIDLSPLTTEVMQPMADALRSKVMNGIAWDEQQQRLFVTGKNWPLIYEIRIELP